MAEFVDAIAEEDLLDETAVSIELDGREVAIIRTGGEVYALQGDCTHAGSPIGEGEVVSDGVIECPGHGATFNVVTGDVMSGPATEALETYEVRIQDGKVQVAIE